MDKLLKTIKRVFYTYPELKKSGVTSTVEWADSNMGVDYSKVVVQSSKSNAKENQLCKILDSNLSAYRWCIVVEKVLDFYKWDCKEKFIRLRYFKKESAVKVCGDIGISIRTLRYWEQEILLKASMWARELKLI